MDKIAELVKAGRVREISDMRDETDLGGLKIDALTSSAGRTRTS